ncbi:MAG: sigma-54-dependent Fis family transcriptional regulator [Porticoccaceae bacterium]
MTLSNAQQRAVLPTPEYLSRVASAWERFVSNEPISKTSVREEVLASWQRCSAQGIDPYRRQTSKLISDNELLQLRSRNDILISALAKSLPKISDRLTSTQCALVAADANATLLSIDGDRAFVDSLKSQWSAPGQNWGEMSIGTNAIGTALTLGRTVQIFGQEHFCLADKELSCIAGLVRDPFDQQTLGVVNISTNNSASIIEIPDLLASILDAINGEIEAGLAADWAKIKEAHASLQRPGKGLLAFDRYGRLVQTHATERQAPSLVTGQRLTGLDADAIRNRAPKSLPNWIRAEQIHWFQDGSGGLIHIDAPQSRRRLRPQPTLAPACEGIAEASPALRPLLQRAQLYSARKMPILLLGETGNGKDVFANAIHRAHHNDNAPFVAVNCAALPRDLIASELFGHAEGAFTGSRRGGAKGRFEDAHGGTIFLDEIGDMPLELQPYLLRVLEEREVSRLGESTRRKIDVQVIAATNKPLADKVAEGLFREDLFYRLNGASLQIPPLRERMADLPHLIQTLLKKIVRTGEAVPVLGEGLLEKLAAYHWPGNIRELRNVLECLVALSPDGILEWDDLAPDFIALPFTNTFNTDIDLGSNQREGQMITMEREMISRALCSSEGDVNAAAKILGISRATVYRRIKQYNLG